MRGVQGCGPGRLVRRLEVSARSGARRRVAPRDAHAALMGEPGDTIHPPEGDGGIPGSAALHGRSDSEDRASVFHVSSGEPGVGDREPCRRTSLSHATRAPECSRRAAPAGEAEEQARIAASQAGRLHRRHRPVRARSRLSSSRRPEDLPHPRQLRLRPGDEPEGDRGGNREAVEEPGAATIRRCAPPPTWRSCARTYGDSRRSDGPNNCCATCWRAPWTTQRSGTASSARWRSRRIHAWHPIHDGSRGSRT